MVAEKATLHPNNIHQGMYDFGKLVLANPNLKQFVITNKKGQPSISFFNPEAVKALNVALLKKFYGVTGWDIPEGYLCPPIPGRADYIHNLADVAKGVHTKVALRAMGNEVPIKVLDVGTGANLVYPIIGAATYEWQFTAVDIDEKSIANCTAILTENSWLDALVKVRLQKSKNHFFKEVIQNDERYDFTMCNPPFHASAAQAESATQRKLKNLTGEKQKETVRNFGGQSNELWCFGGEEKFVADMISESVEFGKQVCWFSSLLSKYENVAKMKKVLRKVGAVHVHVINMGQGNKVSRLIMWSFLTPNELRNWGFSH